MVREVAFQCIWHFRQSGGPTMEEVKLFTAFLEYYFIFLWFEKLGFSYDRLIWHFRTFFWQIPIFFKTSTVQRCHSMFNSFYTTVLAPVEDQRTISVIEWEERNILKWERKVWELLINFAMLRKNEVWAFRRCLSVDKIQISRETCEDFSFNYSKNFNHGLIQSVQNL